MIGLLTSLLLPYGLSMWRRVKSEALLNVIATEVEMAQLKALANKTNVILYIDQAGELCELSQQRRLQPLPKDKYLSMNIKRLKFGPTGQCQGCTLKLWDRVRGLVGEIKVQVASGRPKVQVC
ncbi:MAG: hypothetical protein RLZ12_305 [Bacillota bacterium]|jgi:hypothetical protein